MSGRKVHFYVVNETKSLQQNVLNYINDMKKLYNSILEYIDCNEEGSFELLSILLTILQIGEDANELKSLLQIISSIVNNHYRQIDFFKKIEKLLLYIILDIKKTIKPNDLVKIFKSNKIILLFFIENQVLSVDDLPQTTDFLAYFYPEFERIFLKEEQKQKCLEALKEFNIEYDEDTINNVVLTQSLLIYSIHGNNAEMINFLEESNIKLDTTKYGKLNLNNKIVRARISLNILTSFLCESIKCGHNDIAYYYKEKILRLTGINNEDSEFVDNFIVLKNGIQKKIQTSM